MAYSDVTTVEWVVLIVLVSSCILYIIIQTRAPNLEKYIKSNSSILRCSYLTTSLTIKQAGTPDSSFIEEVGNGDLIFFCGDTPGERTCRWCTGSMFSHVGMLFKEYDTESENDVIYIWESDLGQKTKDGPRVIRLIDKLKKYHGQSYFMWRKLKGKAERPSTKNIMEVVAKYKNYEFDDKMLSWWVTNPLLFFLHDMVKDEKKIFCSELIALTMMSGHISMLEGGKKESSPSPPYLATSYSPNDFTQPIIRGMRSDFSYGPQNFVDFSAFKKSK